MRQALLDGQAPTFVEARHHREFGATIERRQLFVGGIRDPFYLFGQSRIRFQALANGIGAPAVATGQYARQSFAAFGPSISADGVEKGAQILPGLDRADMEHITPSLQIEFLEDAIVGWLPARRRCGPAHRDGVEERCRYVRTFEVAGELARHVIRRRKPVIDMRRQRGELIDELLPIMRMGPLWIDDGDKVVNEMNEPSARSLLQSYQRLDVIAMAPEISKAYDRDLIAGWIDRAKRRVRGDPGACAVSLPETLRKAQAQRDIRKVDGSELAEKSRGARQAHASGEHSPEPRDGLRPRPRDEQAGDDVRIDGMKIIRAERARDEGYSGVSRKGFSWLRIFSMTR